MFRRFILLIVSSIMLVLTTNIVVACSTDSAPTILFVTSYQNAEQNPSEDQLIFNALKEQYGPSNVIAPIFSDQDDNAYANIFHNLISQYHIKKVFINNPSFNNFLSDLKDKFKLTNLVRMIQQFSDTNFYFFNSNIPDQIKLNTPNIYELRFNQATTKVQNPINYGQQIAKNLYDKIRIPDTEKVNSENFNFNVISGESGVKYQIKIGYINNIGDQYQQTILDQFTHNLQPLEDAVYKLVPFNLLKPPIAYNNNTWEVIERTAYNLFMNQEVNFMINTNDWYNNAIAFAASKASNFRQSDKTLKFIVPNVTNGKIFDQDNKTNLLFSFYADCNDIIAKTVNNSFINDDKIYPPSLTSNINCYGINGNLRFVEGK